MKTKKKKKKKGKEDYNSTARPNPILPLPLYLLRLLLLFDLCFCGFPSAIDETLRNVGICGPNGANGGEDLEEIPQRAAKRGMKERRRQ